MLLSWKVAPLFPVWFRQLGGSCQAAAEDCSQCLVSCFTAFSSALNSLWKSTHTNIPISTHRCQYAVCLSIKNTFNEINEKYRYGLRWIHQYTVQWTPLFLFCFVLFFVFNFTQPPPEGVVVNQGRRSGGSGLHLFIFSAKSWDITSLFKNLSAGNIFTSDLTVPCWIRSQALQKTTQKSATPSCCSHTKRSDAEDTRRQ